MCDIDARYDMKINRMAIVGKLFGYCTKLQRQNYLCMFQLVW